MKTVFKWIIFGSYIFIISMILPGCGKQAGTLEKSATLSLSINTQPVVNLKSTNDVSGNGEVSIHSAVISIAELKIEETSGENGQKEDGDKMGNDNHDDGDGDVENDNDDDSEGDVENENHNESDSDEDIFLPGPYLLQVIDGKAIIGEIDVVPGTFSKVEFKFSVVNDKAVGDYSIIVSGEYIADNNSVIPYRLISALQKSIQLPLAEGGVTVEANSKVSLAVVMDIGAWINSLDFSSATISNNIITIDSLNNQDLLKDFESMLQEEIDIDED